MLIAWWENEYE